MIRRWKLKKRDRPMRCSFFAPPPPSPFTCRVRQPSNCGEVSEFTPDGVRWRFRWHRGLLLGRLLGWLQGTSTAGPAISVQVGWTTPARFIR